MFMLGLGFIAAGLALVYLSWKYRRGR